MRRTLYIRLLAAAFVLLGTWVAYTQQQPAPPMIVNKVADDLYELEGPGLSGNVAIYITDEGVILIDDKFEQNYEEIMANVKKLTDKPVKYLLNTHQHGDHTGGNVKFLAANVQIVAQKNARDNMVKLNQKGQQPVTFTDQASVFLGGKEVRMQYFGRGHTRGDAVIYFPALKVLHSGDLMFTGPRAPNVDYSAGGSIVDWTGTLDGVLKLDFDTVIPGHGPIAKKADMVKWQAHIAAVRERVTGMVSQNKTQDEVKQVLMSDFGWLADAAGMRQVPGIMAELKK